MSTGPSEVLVHAGAHCTGAEEFQRFLGANRAAIAAAGYDLAFPGREGAEGGNFDCAFPEPRHRGTEIDTFAPAVASVLEPLFSPDRPLILSEHDLGGRMASLLGGRFYPNARQRAETLRAAIGRPADRLVITLKSYDTIFVAAWRRFAIHRLMEPFEEYAPAMAGFLGGWVDVVEALRDGLEAREVTVLISRPEPAELLSYLAPRLRLADQVMPAASPRITDSAIAMVQRHYRQGARFAPGQRDRILSFHARQPQLPSAQGFAGLRLADLRGRYVADLDTIARMPGVDLVGGVLPAMAAE